MKMMNNLPKFQRISLFRQGKQKPWGKYIFLILIIALILIVNLKPPRDPDLGWHFKTGEYILKNKAIPNQDPFSYTAKEWTPHEWLNDVILYFIYAKGGLFGLSVIFAFITTAIFFIVSKLIKAKIEYCLLATLLGSLASGPITGPRAQVFTLLGLAILLFILFRFRANQNKKIIYFLPLLFLVWANLHGGFIIGLFAFSLFLFFEALKIAYFWVIKHNKKVGLEPQRVKLVTFLKIKNFFSFSGRRTLFFFRDFFSAVFTPQVFTKISQIFIFLGKWVKRKLSNNELVKESLSFSSWLKLSYLALFSFATTFINPYGGKLYIILFQWGESAYGRERIAEWQPVAFKDLMSWDFIMYLGLLAILALIYFKKIDFTLLGSSIVFGVLSFSSWRNMPLLLIIITPLWVYIVKNAADPILSKILKQKFLLFLLLITTILIGYDQVHSVWVISHYPEALARGWGYPRGAVQFIKAHPEMFEGNMFNEYNWGGYLIWQLPEKKVFIDGRMIKVETFKEYDEVRSLSRPEEIIAKYNIEWMLIYRNSLLESYLPYHGWEKVYEDNVSVIYVKEK